MFAFRPSSQEIFGLEWQHMATIPEQSFWDGCHIFVSVCTLAVPMTLRNLFWFWLGAEL